MSHFTRINTQMVNREYILKTLSDLNLEWETGDAEIRTLEGIKRKVDIKIKTGLLRPDIGLVKSGKSYSIIGDWYSVSGMKRFHQKVLQRYAYHAAMDKLQAQGFNLVNEEQQEDGQIHLVLRRMGK
jgi:hypothetical protein